VARPVAPSTFFFLILPYGASFGFVSVALTFLARENGVTVPEIGTLVALAFLPHTWKFLYAPIVDTTLTRKAWYVIGLAILVAGTGACLLVPITRDSLGTITKLVLVTQIGLTLLNMGCEAFIGYAVSDAMKGRAAGWYQAGQLFGLGVGGAAMLWLAQHVSHGLTAALSAVGLTACGVPMLFLDEPEGRDREGVRAAFATLLRDIVKLATSRAGIIALLIALAPIGSGAASNLFSAIAVDWRASDTVVEVANGVGGGIAAAGGALAAAWVGTRMSRTTVYAIAAALVGGSAVAMALTPHTPTMYVVWTLAYQVFLGYGQAVFVGFIFETIGKGAVATKYNIFASLLNLRVVYATRLDGIAHASWGADGVLFTDTALTVAGLVALGLLVAVARSGPKAATA
jgi:MFS family permease